jgi:hypothetical protein
MWFFLQRAHHARISACLGKTMTEPKTEQRQMQFTKINSRQKSQIMT